MGMLIYWFMFLQKPQCLTFWSVCDAEVCYFGHHAALTSVSQSPSHSVCPLGHQDVVAAAVPPCPCPMGKWSQRAFPMHLVTCLGSNQGLFPARVEVTKLYVSPWAKARLPGGKLWQGDRPNKNALHPPESVHQAVWSKCELRIRKRE